MGFRIHATRQLPRISRALGAERTREELIPFVVDSTDDEDEVLLTLAEAVGASLSSVIGRWLVGWLGGVDGSGLCSATTATCLNQRLNHTPTSKQPQGNSTRRISGAASTCTCCCSP